jgi:hypothetical protein
MVFDALRLRGAFCTCKNGFSKSGDPTAVARHADEIARCRHVLATVLALGLAQASLRDVVQGAHRRLSMLIFDKRGTVNVRYVCSSACVWPPRVECLKMSLEDAQVGAMDARGVVALHDQLFDGGWKAMNAALRASRDLMDMSKQTLGSLPFYAYSKMKRPDLVALLHEHEIVLPRKGTVETLAWLLVKHQARAGDAKHMSEVARLTCVHCKTVYFDDEGGRRWICCSQRGCFQWNHTKCEDADGEAVKKQKKYLCRRCLDTGGKKRNKTVEQTSVFFDNDSEGPPAVSLDEALSGHHVVDRIRANRHVRLGDVVFPDDDMGAL